MLGLAEKFICNSFLGSEGSGTAVRDGEKKIS